MKSIKISLEYGCFPVWIYDEDGNLIDTAMPPEIADDKELAVKFNSIQDRFEETYVDNGIEFCCKGFESEEEQNCFTLDLNAACRELEEKCCDHYRINRSYYPILTP